MRFMTSLDTRNVLGFLSLASNQVANYGGDQPDRRNVTDGASIKATLTKIKKHVAHNTPRNRSKDAWHKEQYTLSISEVASYFDMRTR